MRTLIVCGLTAVLALAGLVVGGVWWGTDHYGDQVARIPHAFPSGPRPHKPPGNTGGTTFLLAGVDRRSDKPTTGRDAQTALWQYGAQRSDTLMLVHFSADERRADIVSIPRDSWVPIPGHGSAKINASFSWGGPALLVQTVEQLTGARIDHFGIVDWYGFKSLTDAVGGVPITVHENSYDSEQHLGFKTGTHTMNGTEALSYVRQRHGLPGGELDRIRRQQQFLRSLVGEMRGEVSVTNPLGIARMLDTITRTVSVDDNMSNADLRDLVLGLRHLNTSDAHFGIAPIVHPQMIRGQYALILDREKLRAQWRAVETGDLS
ncbi:LCP family protein [Streptomyces sp. NPDC005485]|uniref:LCP family protein n=1 Tax=Streptomyces sp. NPDC005485 TaxID=3155591 RepID=UPI0033A8E803